MPGSRSTPVRLVRDSGVVAYTAEVPASPSDLFAILANPHRHHELDGSGSVQAEVRGPERLAPGDRFSTHMRLYGVPYVITNTVSAVEEDRLIEWVHPGGHRWRWELERLPDGGTRVTESWIARGARLPLLAYRIMGAYARNDDGIRQSLERAARIMAGRV
ncbi:SRPBCC family protein [Arthrobacter sp. UM1]|nr:SRPBCC family protein [Arthrobacter sp. UM1]